MNLKDQMILEEYRKERPAFVKLGDTVSALLKERMKLAGIDTLAVEHRVKKEDSLAGKLERKGDKYHSLSDLTDIMGARVICFFADDVDRVGKLVEALFEIDWENSVDKRALIQADSFGYLSLHYICSIPQGTGYPDEICNKKFEIQVRTILQHTWASIHHDRGYKSEFGIPRMAARQYARIAGLLEIADDEFVRVRDDVLAYTEDTKQKIMRDEAGDVRIDSVSLKEYVLRSRKMRAFLEELAAICGSEISDIDPEAYLEQLQWLGKKTLGELDQMLNDNRALAYAMAKQALENTDLDILSSNVGLRFLCRAELVRKQYPLEQVVQFMKLSATNAERAQRMAESLLRTAQGLQEEN